MFHFILKLCHKIKTQTKSFFMQIKVNLAQQFKCSNVYVVKDTISYNCFTAIMKHFVVKKCYSRHQMAQLVSMGSFY